MDACCASPRAARRRKRGALSAATSSERVLSGGVLPLLLAETEEDDDDAYVTAEEDFRENADCMLPSPPASPLRPPGSLLVVPWRRRRAFNWDGCWREDKSLSVGLMEGFEKLGYPWWVLRIMQATPGATWTISGCCDEGHTLTFDTNSRVMNKMLTLQPIKIRYGDGRHRTLARAAGVR